LDAATEAIALGDERRAGGLAESDAADALVEGSELGADVELDVN
jgi:hypothetical protein